MKQTALVVAVLLAAAPVLAGEPRVLERTVLATGLDTVRLDAGVGDVEVVGADVAEVSVSVELKPRRGGFFSSMKTAQREVDEAVLSAEVSKGALALEIDSDGNDRHFEERWTIALPASLAFTLEVGVGDVEVRGVTGALDLQVGVGEVLAEGVSGDVTIELGVGDATVSGAASHYGSVDGSGGVGDARLTIRGERISSSGFVGHSAEWSGDGEHSIDIEVGVGDARVTLE
jgi:hypothetical protein